MGVGDIFFGVSRILCLCRGDIAVVAKDILFWDVEVISLQVVQ